MPVRSINQSRPQLFFFLLSLSLLVFSLTSTSRIRRRDPARGQEAAKRGGKGRRRGLLLLLQGGINLINVDGSDAIDLRELLGLFLPALGRGGREGAEEHGRKVQVEEKFRATVGGRGKRERANGVALFSTDALS